VKVDLKIIPGEKAAEVVKGRDFEIIFYGQAVGADPDVYAFWHSSQAKTGGLNIANYNNPEVDALLLEGRGISDTSERIIRYKKFQENIASNLPAIFLYSPTYTYVQSKKVHGFSAAAIIEPSDRFASIADWYLKTKTKLTW
jgi:peptide/nickel transport system substrate-binding protein